MFILDNQYKLTIGGLDNNNSPYKEDFNNDFRSFEEIKEELSNQKYYKHYLLQGGEPSIHKELLKIIRFLLDLSPKSVSILTNARIYSQDDIVDSLFIDKRIEFIVKIWNCSDKLHDKITQVRGSYDQSITGIKKLLNRGFKVSVIVPVIKQNYDNLFEILEEISKLDIYNLYFVYPTQDFLTPIARIDYESVISKVRNLKILKNNSFLVSFKQFKDIEINEIFNKKLNLEKNPFKNKIDLIKNKVCKYSLINITSDEIFYILRTIEKRTKFWDVVYSIGYPIPLVLLILDELKNNKIIEIKQDKLKLRVKLKKLNKVMDFSNLRLKSDPSVCQLTVSQEDIEKRINEIITSCSSGGNIVILGDDDFISLSIASTGLFNKIIVFEIDPKIVKRINDIAEKNNLNVLAIQHDLRKKIPNRYKHKFDVFYTDSPYSVNGFKLFVSRGVSLLKKELKKHGFASFTCEMAIVEGVEMPVQNIIQEMGLFIETKAYPGKNDIPSYIKQKYNDIGDLKKRLFISKDIFDKQEEWYFGALGRKEFLFHFLTSDNTKSLILDDFYEDIYYDEEQTPLQFYTDLEYIKTMKDKYPGSYRF